MTFVHAVRRTTLQLALGLTAVGAITRSSPADTRPVSSKADVGRLPAEAARLYADTTLFPREVKYREIPWLLDLEEGIRLAKREGRPLLVWTSGDDPLERC
jgi:hypothetical protein